MKAILIIANIITILSSLYHIFQLNNHGWSVFWFFWGVYFLYKSARL